MRAGPKRQHAVMATQRGFTLVEMLVAALVLAAVAGLAAVAWPKDDVGRAFARQVVAARAEAIVRGRNVTLSARPCPDTLHAQAPLPAATVVAYPARGLLFTAEGLPRTCDGGGVGNATILLERRGRRAAVIVSALGRVRWEAR
jgi:prepilin-type N-terminal cleavage/methylation domain-containing protein